MEEPGIVYARLFHFYMILNLSQYFSFQIVTPAIIT